MKPALIKALEKLVVWVKCDLLPLWQNRGSVMTEGWIEARLDRCGNPDATGPILLASQAQIANVFARAEHLGWMGGSRMQVRKLIEFAGRHGTLPCRSDGYVHSLDRQFSILDERYHLADHALFMLASTASYAAYGDGSDTRRAYNIFDWLQLRLVHPQGGWFEDSDLRLQRSARSHFYMLQAFLYLYEITQKPRWLDAAEALVTLYQQKLLDKIGLRLYCDYQEDWTPAGKDAWCPEDQFLWIYAVHKFARCSGRTLSAADLYHSVCESQALGPDGLFLEKVGAGGDGAFATGALAAAILAGISLAVEGDQKAAAALEDQIQAFFRLCMAEGPAGLFVDRLNSAGAPDAYTSAATTLTLFDAARDAAKWLKTAGVKT
jgi:mannose/cellobiose epimerase-like protein (N-acyl-D-glucosamine 2-epimerase family)